MTPSANTPDLQDETLPDLATLFRILRLLGRRARRWVRANEPLLTSLMEVWARFHALDRSGWLPHPTTPFHLLDPHEEDPAVARRIVGGYYRSEWPVVEAAFRARLAGHGFDPETLATFDEALIAHRHQLYRATARTLFPDIERKVRDTFFAGDLAATASLREMRKAVARLGAGNLNRSGVVSLKLYSKFENHLYSRVKTVAERDRIAADPVPNRHATVHGLVVYATDQSSLNALIMAEYAHLAIVDLERSLADAPV